jgi:phage-related minor tail protein
MQQGLSNMMPLLTVLIEQAATFAGYLNDVFDRAGDIDVRMRIGPLQDDLVAAEGRLDELARRRDGLNRSIDSARSDRERQRLLGLSAQITDEILQAEIEVERLTSRIATLQSPRATTDGGPGEPPVLPILPTSNRRTDADRERSRLERLAETYRRDLAGALGVYERSLDEVARLVDENLLTQEEGLRVEIGLRETLNQTLEKERQTRLAAATDPMSGAQRALEAIQEQAFDSASLIEKALTGAFSGIEDSMVQLATTGKASFSDLVDSLKADAARLISRQLITGPASQLLSSALSGLFGGGPSISAPTNLFPFADGGVMSQEGPLPLNAYSLGGIASSPQMAIYGEGRKPEAYVPLPDGRTIPVTMQGGGGVGGGLVEVAVRFDDTGNLQAVIERTAGNITARAFKAHNEQRQRAERIK